MKPEVLREDMSNKTCCVPAAREGQLSESQLNIPRVFI